MDLMKPISIDMVQSTYESLINDKGFRHILHALVATLSFELTPAIYLSFWATEHSELIQNPLNSK